MKWDYRKLLFRLLGFGGVVVILYSRTKSDAEKTRFAYAGLAMIIVLGVLMILGAIWGNRRPERKKSNQLE